MDVEAAAAAGEVDLTNALDLSESEEEEELEDLIEDFALRAEIGEVCRPLCSTVPCSNVTLPGTRRSSRTSLLLPVP